MIIECALVASTLDSSLSQAASMMLASMFLVVVLPLLPVTAINGILNWLRQAAPNLPSAWVMSPTINCGRVDSTGRLTSAAAAPFLRASST